MDKIGLERGLIRYTSQDELESGTRKLIRPRLVVYSAILVVMFGALAFSLARKSTADVTILRGLGAPFQVLDNGEVTNQIRLKITNRSGEDRSYGFELGADDRLTMIAPENPLAVAAGDTQMTAAFIAAPRSAFVDGDLAIVLQVSDGVDFSRQIPYLLLGPTEDAKP
jgi:polyferredoxin